MIYAVLKINTINKIYGFNLGAIQIDFTLVPFAFISAMVYTTVKVFPTLIICDRDGGEFKLDFNRVTASSTLR